MLIKGLVCAAHNRDWDGGVGLRLCPLRAVCVSTTAIRVTVDSVEILFAIIFLYSEKPF